MLGSKGQGTRVATFQGCVPYLVDIVEHLVKLLDVFLVNLSNAGQLVGLGDSTFDPYLWPQDMEDL